MRPLELRKPEALRRPPVRSKELAASRATPALGLAGCSTRSTGYPSGRRGYPDIPFADEAGPSSPAVRPRYLYLAMASDSPAKIISQIKISEHWKTVVCSGCCI